MLLQVVDWYRHKARRKVWNHDRALGRRGEDIAHRYLRRRGYVIVARNYMTRSGSGEVDIIAWDKETLVFVEVKTRSSVEFGTPDSAVDAEKQHKLMIAARDYARRANVNWDMTRFDIVSVVTSTPIEITLLRDAFPKSMAARQGAL
jgi:putative endonuclease